LTGWDGLADRGSRIIGRTGGSGIGDE